MVLLGCKIIYKDFNKKETEKKLFLVSAGKAFISPL